MLINFQELMEMMIMIYEFGQPLVINGIIVNEFNFPEFISSYYDT